MRWWCFLSLFITAVVVANPSNPIAIAGSVDLTSNSSQSLQIRVSDKAILHWNDFSIGVNEQTQFIQPSHNSWVLNRVTGKNISEILGRLDANGHILLLNPNGILFGKDAVVEVGGLIASAMDHAVWKRDEHQQKGSVINYGTIRSTCGDVVLLGHRVHNEGKIDVLMKINNNIQIRLGDKGNIIHAEENPYGFVVQRKCRDALHLSYEGGRILLKSEALTEVKGSLSGSTITLLSDGITDFTGHASIDSGSMEISGRHGFYHRGTIDRCGGKLLLDPESAVTISGKMDYNHSRVNETFLPTADLSNISIHKLIEEIEKGPVEITTAYEGEGGVAGSIMLLDDVKQTYNSPYPLTLFSTGTDGITLAGNLTNTGTGTIEFKAPHGTVAAHGIIETSGTLSLTGKKLDLTGALYGRDARICIEKEVDIKGILQVSEGDLDLHTGGSIQLAYGEISNLGSGHLRLQGLHGAHIQDISLSDGARLLTSNRSKGLIIEDIEGLLRCENSILLGNNAPIRITGKTGSCHLLHSSISSMAPIDIDLGRALHLDNSTIQTEKCATLSLGTDLVMTEKAHLSCPGGLLLNTKGDIILVSHARISGRGLSLCAGENLTLLKNTTIDGGNGTLFLSSLHDFISEGGVTQSGQLYIHAGHSICLSHQSKVASYEGTASLFANSDIWLNHNACVSSKGGDLNVTASQGHLFLYGNSLLASTSHGATIIAGKSLVMENFSSINTLGEHGTSIIVDHQAMGGGLIMGKTTSINTGTSPLRIFTAKRELNEIRGKLNHHYLVDTPLYLSTNEQQWGTPYPGPSPSETPFTIFHKENGLIQLIPGGITQTDFIRLITTYIGPFTAELFRDLHPYNEFINWSIEFQNNYRPLRFDHDETSSFNVLGEQPYFIRSQSRRDTRNFFNEHPSGGL